MNISFANPHKPPNPNRWKPNLAFFGCLLVVVVGMGFWLFMDMQSLLWQLNDATSTGEAKDAAYGLLAHIAGGAAVLIPAITMIGGVLVKLLDSDPEPSVPESVVLELIRAHDEAAVRSVESAADAVEANRKESQ